ncbi:MAG TPA: hypothetical protein VFG25_01790 [Nitrosopumilaceae archaeon]|nr:hypothetical protein [Nitrosopumilaceae archaeon]
MKPHKISIFAGIAILVFGATFMSTSPGIEKITIGLPLVVSGMVIVGIIVMIKSKTIRNFPI